MLQKSNLKNKLPQKMHVIIVFPLFSLERKKFQTEYLDFICGSLRDLLACLTDSGALSHRSKICSLHLFAVKFL